MVRAVKPPPRHPFTLLKVPSRTWYRVHPIDPVTGDYAPSPFNDSGKGNARFSPIFSAVNLNAIPTIYAANSERGAIEEIVLHDVPTPSTGYLHDIESDLAGTLHMSAVTLPELTLANLSTTGLQAAGLELADLFAGEKWDYPRTREWAVWIWENLLDAEGLFWMSRRDTRSEAIMLFGNRVGNKIVDEKRSLHIAEYEDLIVELLAEMGAGIAPRI